MANRLLNRDEIMNQLTLLDGLSPSGEHGYVMSDTEIVRRSDGKVVRYTAEDLMMPIHEFSRFILYPLVHQKHEPTMVALKNDTDKDPWHLAPWDAFRAIVKVMAFGAKKYKERDWEQGFDWHRLHRAAIEHLTSWWEGEDKDPETGYSHLWHAGCCVTFLIAHEIRGIGKDDRPKRG